MVSYRFVVAIVVATLVTGLGRPGHAALSGARGEGLQSLPAHTQESPFGAWMFRLAPDIDLGAVLSFEAVRLLAEAGNPAAQYVLATMWIEGLGVEPDWSKGLVQLEKAAQADYAPALAILGFFKITADHVAQDIDGGRELIDRAVTAGAPPGRR